jgi:nucleoid-associated protein YgaU
VGFLDDLKKNLGFGEKAKQHDEPQAGTGVEASAEATPGPAALDHAAADQAALDHAAADQAAADQAASDQAAHQEADERAAAQAAAQAEAAPAPAPPAAVSEVVVEAGDTLSGIAVQFGVDLHSLIAANADTVPNPDVIYPGQVLRLP